MYILLHSSKTMRSPAHSGSLRAPQLLEQAKIIDSYLKSRSAEQLIKVMHLSEDLARKTHQLIAQWSAEPNKQSLALDSFVGDIYSGLRANELAPAERDYADKVLGILSGLYGIIRPYDGICPYRLEMGYKLPDFTANNLYEFWGAQIADCLPKEGPIINASSEEFTRTITPFIDEQRLFAPKFLTVDPKTGEPAFKVVHAKIARGAFARWLIQTGVTEPGDLSGFDDLGYHFAAKLSTPQQPTFVCEAFEGKGLSMKS
jgi:uncharacterized protein